MSGPPARVPNQPLEPTAGGSCPTRMKVWSARRSSAARRSAPMRGITFVIVALTTVGLSSPVRAKPGGDATDYECAGRSDIVASCFSFRGRLSFWNGAPSARIWPVGSKRLLGVHFDRLPPKLEADMTAFDPRRSFDTEVWAIFTVCPFTKIQPRHMQFVCIESWRNPRFKHRVSPSPNKPAAGEGVKVPLRWVAAAPEPQRSA